jgi:hypothetical protein
MVTRLILFLVLTALLLGSLLYVAAMIPNAELPQTLAEFRLRHFALVVAPISGIILWFWALYDWGMRRLDRLRKLVWLVILIFTMGFGAIAYFISFGFREEIGEG